MNFYELISKKMLPYAQFGHMEDIAHFWAVETAGVAHKTRYCIFHTAKCTACQEIFPWEKNRPNFCIYCGSREMQVEETLVTHAPDDCPFFRARCSFCGEAFASIRPPYPNNPQPSLFAGKPHFCPHCRTEFK